MRTIICSDAHGYPQLIEDALAAASFRPGVDRFVYAGDLIDRGPDPLGCFELVEQLANVVLFGNHEVACSLGFDISPTDPKARVLAPLLRERALDADGTWRLAKEVDGILVVHAGISEPWRDAFEGCGRDVTAFASLLDSLFRAEFAAALDAGGNAQWGDGVLAFGGPLWFRPLEEDLPLVDLRQVVGHTPVEFYGPGDEGVLGGFGVHLIDPGAYRFRGADGTGGHFRCAIVEDGAVEILTSDPSPRRLPDSDLACY